jgi:predicted nucleotidyltransferase
MPGQRAFCQKRGAAPPIEGIKRIAAPLAKQYGAERVFLIGSCARGEANGDSDADFHMGKGAIADFMTWASLLTALGGALGTEVIC